MHWIIPVLVLLEKYMIWQVQAASCTDESALCGSFERKGYCKESYQCSKLVRVICCESCQKAACVDTSRNCGKYVKKEYCAKTHRYGRWMAKHCCKSCKQGKQAAKPTRKPLPQRKKPKSQKQSGTNKLKGPCMKSVNSYRAKHINTPPLEWDDNLAAKAQAYADVLKRKSLSKRYVVLEHDTVNNRKLGDEMGENLWYHDNRKLGTCADADRDWYNEINDYSYGTAKTKNGKPTGHFTQMVWRSTTRFGVGIATFKSMKFAQYGNMVTIIVAKYQKPGNFAMRGREYEDYTKNVQPLKALNDVTTDDVIDDTMDVMNEVEMMGENELETLFE